MRVLRYGEHAVLAEVEDTGAVLTLLACITGTAGVLELVPAARTLLVRFDPDSTDAERIERALVGAQPVPPPVQPARAVELTVDYDGTDLADVARESGLSVPDVIARHCAGNYRVAFCGFAPGFAYLTGLDPALHLPRLAQPRTEVPAGSVAIAGEFAGVYPRPSPGGWRLLGRTDATLWDLARRPPALLVPGTSVRFVAS